MKRTLTARLARVSNNIHLPGCPAGTLMSEWDIDSPMSACTLMSDGMLHALVDLDFIIYSKRVGWSYVLSKALKVECAGWFWVSFSSSVQN